MTNPIAILGDNWDAGICTKPDIIDDTVSIRDAYSRVVSLMWTDIQYNTMGIPIPQHLDQDSHDAYEIWVISNTEADLRNMVKAILKVNSNYTPVQGEENILQLLGGDIEQVNAFRFQIHAILILSKAGISAY